MGKDVYTQDLKFIVVLSLLAVSSILIPFLSGTPLRILFPFLLVFFIPGYAFIAAMFPGKDCINGVERLTLSIGLSIAIAIFDGFAISLTKWLLRPDSLIISLSLLTMLFVVMAYVSRSRISADDRFTFSLEGFIDSIRIGETDASSPVSTSSSSSKELQKVLLIVVIGSILVASGMLVYAKVNPSEENFTTLYILGSDGMASDYPKVASMGSPITFMVGVENHENQDMNYTLQMRLDGEVLQEDHISLEDGGEWLDNLTYAPSQLRNTRSKLEFIIFKEEGDDPYRSVHLWIGHGQSLDYLRNNIHKISLSSIPSILNGDMESSSGWKFSSTGDGVNGSYANESGVYLSRAYVMNNSYIGMLQGPDDQYHDISQTLFINESGTALLSVFVKDTHWIGTNWRGESQFKHILVNNVLIWGDGVAEDEGWQHVQFPVNLKKGKNTITLRLAQMGDSEVYPVEVFWDEVEIQPLSELFPDISEENTIEFVLPSSSVLPLPDYYNKNSFRVEWSGSDVGSGISHYSIDYSLDGVNWKNWISETEDTSATFSGKRDATYYFRSKAVDGAGNIEFDHLEPDAQIKIDTASPSITLDIDPNPSSGFTTLTARSSEALSKLDCLITPNRDGSWGEYVKMTSSNGIIWTGSYDVEENVEHEVKLTADDLAGNKGLAYFTIYPEPLEFDVGVSPNPTNTSATITVTSPVLLNKTPSVYSLDSSSRSIPLSKLSFSGDEYRYTANIGPGVSQGNATFNVTGYSKDSEIVAGSAVFVIDRSDPLIENIVPADGSVLNGTDITIGATFSDAITSIDQDRLVLRVNDEDVILDAVVNSTSITYVYPVTSDETVEVYLNIYDIAGNSASRTWDFSISS